MRIGCSKSEIIIFFMIKIHGIDQKCPKFFFIFETEGFSRTRALLVDILTVNLNETPMRNNDRQRPCKLCTNSGNNMFSDKL